MHIKGKRHKLTFKTKVDPEYDVKCSFKLIQSMKLKMWQQRVPQMIAEKYVPFLEFRSFFVTFERVRLLYFQLL